MSQTVKRKRKPHHLTPGKKLLLVLVLLLVFSVCSTVFLNLSRLDEEEQVPTDGSGWENSVTAYVLAEEGSTTVPFYNEGFAVVKQCARGTEVELESWEPFVSESEVEYYHVYLDGQFGYIQCRNVTDNKVEILQENRIYVRSTVNLLAEPGSVEIGNLVEKGTLLRLMGYDYFRDDGTVNMYQVKLGDELGWIKSDYVAFSYDDAMSNWTNDHGSYSQHEIRGDDYGGGDAADLDYFPHEKGDFADEGNAMPENCYSLYIAATRSDMDYVTRNLEMAEGTTVNTFVFTIFDDGEIAYPSELLESYGLGGKYECENSMEQFAEVVKMVQDAGYYTVARICTFQDRILAQTFPEWAITNANGTLMELNSSYWPSAYCRDVWKLKVGLAVEAVETFGFDEIQFDYVRFPDFISEGADLKNNLNESKAQAVQRFLTYACDVLHAHGAYVGADVFGEVANDYVAPYGQYWPAISTVVDVISGMPYPDHFSSYFNYATGRMYRYYEHPYQTLYEWGLHVAQRQSECSTPAVVRTWLQTWDQGSYKYDTLAIQKEIVALYDAGIPQGYMPWYSLGSLHVKEALDGVIAVDYYDLYKKAQAEGKDLSEYMGIETENT